MNSKAPSRAIYWDMDGTIADLYGVPNWEPRLRAFDATPYLQAPPMWDMLELEMLLLELKCRGWHVGIITWLSKDNDRDYALAVRRMKRRWERLHAFDFVVDERHAVRYGTPKHLVPRYKRGILVDDNAQVRADWERHGGRTIDPTQGNLIERLKKLLEE